MNQLEFLSKEMNIAKNKLSSNFNLFQSSYMFRIQTSSLFEVKENVKMSDLRNQACFEGRLKMEIQNPNVEKKRVVNT